MMYSPSILSNQDINEPDKSVLNSEVFSFQGLFVKYMNKCGIWDRLKCPVYGVRGVLIEGAQSTVYRSGYTLYIPHFSLKKGRWVVSGAVALFVVCIV